PTGPRAHIQAPRHDSFGPADISRCSSFSNRPIQNANNENTTSLPHTTIWFDVASPNQMEFSHPKVFRESGRRVHAGYRRSRPSRNLATGLLLGPRWDRQYPLWERGQP